MRKASLFFKTIFALAVLCAIVLCLSTDIISLFKAPVQTQPPYSDTTPSTSVTPGETTPDVPDIGDGENALPNWSIKSTVVKNTLKNSDGDILCEVRYSYPYAIANDSSDIAPFSEALSSISNDVKKYVDSRCELYKSGSADDFSVPPQITGYYKINRFSPEIFSISFVFAEILPDAQTREMTLNYSLDLLLGAKEISLDEVMNDPINALVSLVSAKKENGEIPALYSSYDKKIESMIDSVWSVTSDGIRFVFPVGTIAPSSSGDIEILLGGEQLLALLSEYGKILLSV